MWASLGNPELTPEVKEKIVSGVLEEADGHAIDDLSAQRDAMLFALLAARAKYSAPETAGSRSASS